MAGTITEMRTELPPKPLGVEVDWGSFTMESRWEAFSRSIYFPKLFLQLAPPCSTFSRARDRARRTRVRSMNQPAGIRPRSKKVKEGNEMAKQAIMFARWAHNEFDATVTFENPDRSYLWIFGMPWFGPPRTYKDVRMSYCHFGR